eukprot:9052944-Pyramimonas_sp.AAC.1
MLQRFGSSFRASERSEFRSRQGLQPPSLPQFRDAQCSFSRQHQCRPAVGEEEEAADRGPASRSAATDFGRPPDGPELHVDMRGHRGADPVQPEPHGEGVGGHRRQHR